MSDTEKNKYENLIDETDQSNGNNQIKKSINNNNDAEDKDYIMKNISNEDSNDNKVSILEREEDDHKVDFMKSTYKSQEESLKQRTFFQRTFGKMDEGSVRGSIFSLICFVMGSGCLSMPYSINKMGIFPGSISIFLGGISSLWSLNLLIYSAEKTKIRDYKLLAKEVLGDFYSKLIDWLIALYQFFLLVGFMVTAYQVIANVMFMLFYQASGDFTDFKDFLDRGIVSKLYFKFSVIFGMGSFFIVPICLVKDVSKLKVFSLIGICLLFYNIFTLVALSPKYISHNIEKKVQYNWWNPALNGFKSDLLFFPAFGNIFFALNASIGAFPIYNQLKTSTSRRINKVFSRAIVVMTVMLVTLGIIGYLTMPEDTNIIIIFRDTISKDDKDLYLTVGKVLYVVSLFFTIANNYIVGRITIVNMIYGKDAELTDRRNYLITLPLMFVVMLISSVYQQIASILSILGGYLAVISLYILPVWIYVKVNPYKITHYKNVLSIVCGGILVSMGYIGGTISLINMIKSK